jgi:hypothetical protein
MTINDLFYLITGLMFVASGVTIFGFKKKALGLGVFGLAWMVMGPRLILEADVGK